MKRISVIFFAVLLIVSLASQACTGSQKTDPTGSSFHESDAPQPSRTPVEVIPAELPEGEWVKTIFVRSSVLTPYEEQIFNQVAKEIDLTQELPDWEYYDADPDDEESTAAPTESLDEKYSSIFQPVTVIAKNIQKEYTDYAYLVAVALSNASSSYWSILTIRDKGKANASFLTIRKIDPTDLHTSSLPPDEDDPDCFLPTEELTKTVMLYQQAQEAYEKAAESHENSLLDPLSLLAVRSDEGTIQYLILSRAITKTGDPKTVIEFLTITATPDTIVSVTSEEYMDLEAYTTPEEAETGESASAAE